MNQNICQDFSCQSVTEFCLVDSKTKRVAQCFCSDHVNQKFKSAVKNSPSVICVPNNAETMKNLKN